MNGKSFADFDDYNNYFAEFYDFADEILNYDGEIEDDAQDLWKILQGLVENHVNALNESYDKDNKEALTIIEQLLTNYKNELENIIQMIEAE